MQIDTQAHDFSLTDALRRHTERRLRFATTYGGDRVKRIAVRLSDINGPRGGADKRCHLRIVLNGQPDVVVTDVETDLYAAINRAAGRARNALLRKLDRRHARIKHGRTLDLAVDQAAVNDTPDPQQRGLQA